MGFISEQQYRGAFDASEGVHKVALMRWDTGTLAWVKFTGGDPLAPASNVTVLNDFLTDAQLRATPLPVATYAERIDEASSTVTYFGKAVIGTADAGTVWQIKRLTETGTVVLTEWADGDALFNNQWSNRASLSYS
jgi:hypothetical protein